MATLDIPYHVVKGIVEKVRKYGKSLELPPHGRTPIKVFLEPKSEETKKLKTNIWN